MGNTDLFSGLFRKVEAPTVNKRTSIVDADIYRAMRARIGDLYCRAER
jgi:hypothetical protein